MKPKMAKVLNVMLDIVNWLLTWYLIESLFKRKRK